MRTAYDLSPEQEQQLAAIIEAGAMSVGSPNEAWTLPRLARLVRERFGVDHHASHLSRVLAAMGFSCQRPARRAMGRDEVKIRHWKRHQGPALKKSPA